MNPKALCRWFYQKACDYNLFVPEDNDYDDDDDNEAKDPAAIIKHQKYATWLYVILLMLSLYVLFYITLVTPQSRTVTVSHVTPDTFKQLYLQYPESLSCSCSTVTVSYKDFVTDTIIFHPVCSSIFVSQQWIEALYLINASRYGVTDFRTTANAQFQLLADFCALSKITVDQNRIDFGNNEFVTTNLVPEEEIQSATNTIVEFFKNIVSAQIIIFLNYIRNSIQTNYIISALNTNIVFGVLDDQRDIVVLSEVYKVRRSILNDDGIQAGYNQNVIEFEWNTSEVTQATAPSKYRRSSRATVAYSADYNVYRAETQYAANFSGDTSNTEHVTCGIGNPTSPAGFFSTSASEEIRAHIWWAQPTENSDVVAGFFGGCVPLEALLPSTLDCLYNIQCLQLLMTYFPALNQINFSVNQSVLSSKQENTTIYNHLLKLFIENSSTKMNYSKYFDNCAPSFCSYTITDQNNLSYAITLFISLYGGLTIILRLIAPFLIKTLFKSTHHATDTTAEPKPQNTHVTTFIQWMKRLNLFKVANDRSEHSIKKQRIITRIYLILLIGSIVVLLIFTVFSTETVTITEKNPSLDTYNNLQILYSHTLRCPCSTTTIPYQKFTSLSPILHQVCSSDFIENRWLSILQNSADYLSLDWRNTAYSVFHLISELCQQANSTIEDAVNHFLSQSFIASSIISETAFNTQLNATLNQFFRSTVISFTLLVDTVGLLMQIDQPHLGAIALYERLARDNTMLVNIVTDEITNEQSFQILFLLNGVSNVNLSSIDCICATDPHCQALVAIYGVDFALTSKMTYVIDYIVPYSATGCSRFSSLLLSQFGCLYNDSDCFQILMNFIRNTYIQNVEYPSWFDPHPLVYDPTSSRYPPNTSISEIVKEIMLEQWNPSYSYEHFYKSCAPPYCTYSTKIRTNTIVGGIIALISIIGGLILSLRLIIPPLINFFIRLFSKNNRRQQQPQQEIAVRVKWYERIKRNMKNLAIYVFNTIRGLNIFALRDFANSTDRATAKRYGRWATRLHSVLFLIGLAILVLYTIIQSHTVTIDFEKPSYNVYNQLKQKYGDNLKCSCSLIASPYEQFVNTEAIFHEVCMSPFVSDALRINLTANLSRDLSTYAQRDYRRFLSAHLQYLQGLCDLSIESVSNSINQFLTSLFITAQLLSENDFNDRITLLIDQSRSKAPIIITSLLYLIRKINQGNAVISKYGTNFEYISFWYNSTQYYYLPTQAIIYDNGCSCGLYSNCTIDASFITSNSSEKVPIKGFKMGCTPSESFRVSTLECYYDQACLDLIQQYTNSSSPMIPLSSTVNQYPLNTSIAELIDNLFIEQWVSTKNYFLYFQQCAPLLCTYSYIQDFNLLYIITVLLGLQGGLTIVLKWICPRIIRIVVKIYEHRKRRMNVVQSVSSIEIAANENADNSVCLTTCDVQPVPKNAEPKSNLHSSNRSRIEFVLMCLVVLLTIVTLIIFSIYVYRQQNNQVTSISPSSNTTQSTVTSMKIISTTTTTMTTTSTTSLPICQLKFQLTTSYRTGSLDGIKSPVVGDFNGDNRTDVAFFDYGSFTMNIWLGYGNGSFRQNQTYLGVFDGWSFMITIEDFNNDNNLDLAFTNEDTIYVYVMLGYGDGTFQMPIMSPVGYDIYLKGIAASDFNNDSYIDVAVVDYWNNYLRILLGNGNGSFSTYTSYYTGRNSYPFVAGIADFNDDGFQDIAVSNNYRRNIGIFLGYGNGTFKEQISSFTGGYYYPYFFIIGEFNDDHRPDVAIAYDTANVVGILFGYGNGSLGGLMKFTAGNVGDFKRITVGDMNGDGHMDIVAGPIEPYNVTILIGNGNGGFQEQIVFSTGLIGTYTWADVADFNSDGCQDILASDEINGAVFILLNTCECRLTSILTTSTSIHP